MERGKLVTLALLVALAASNAVWAGLYQLRSQQLASLQSQLARANRFLTMLTQQVQELEQNNTALHMRIRALRDRLLQLTNLLEQANETVRHSILITSMLDNLNESISKLFDMTFPHAFYTPRLRSFIKPDQVGDVLTDTLGIAVFKPDTAIRDLRMIYNWTYHNIMNSPDQPFVAISSVKYVKMGGKKYVYSFTIVKVNNYIQDALETLLRRAGDCEDKAILLTSLYLAYLESFGDAWAVCVFGAQGYNHCFTVAYVKPLKTYVVADPTLGFFTSGKDLKDCIDQLFAFIGLRWSDINQAIAFNNMEFQSGDIFTIIKYMEAGG